MGKCYICSEEAIVCCSSCYEPICETLILAPSGSIKDISHTDNRTSKLVLVITLVEVISLEYNAFLKTFL